MFLKLFTEAIEVPSMKDKETIYEKDEQIF